jgi:hypothetical protein
MGTEAARVASEGAPAGGSPRRSPLGGHPPFLWHRIDADGIDGRDVVRVVEAAGRTPITTEAVLQEARSGCLPPGIGALPLYEILQALPDETALSVEVPIGDTAPPGLAAARIFSATQKLLKDCRLLERQAEPIGEHQR